MMNQPTRFTLVTAAGALASGPPSAAVFETAGGLGFAPVQPWSGRPAVRLAPFAALQPIPVQQGVVSSGGPDDHRLAPGAMAERGAIAQEREQAARELHDAITQKLFAANLLAGAMARSNDAVVSEQADALARLSRSALSDLQLMLFELQPEALARVPLGDLLQQAAAGLASRCGVEVTTEVDETAPVSPEQKAAVYRIATALLSNVARHSGANRARLQWTAPLSGEACLRITDNGGGFLSPEVPPTELQTRPLGLARVRQHARELNALLVIQSAPGEGTDITLTFQRSCEKK